MNKFIFFIEIDIIEIFVLGVMLGSGVIEISKT